MIDFDPEILLYPWVKKTVSQLARISLISCFCFFGASLLAGLLFGLGFVFDGGQMLDFLVQLFLFSASLTYFFFSVFLLGIGMLWPWCHMILLEGRGNGLARLLSPLVSFFALIYFVCTIFSLVTGRLLLASQADTPIIIGMLMLVSLLLNLDHMKAISVLMRVRLICVPVLILIIVVVGESFPLMILWLFAGILLLLSFPLLRYLNKLAPYIVGLPELRPPLQTRIKKDK